MPPSTKISYFEVSIGLTSTAPGAYYVATGQLDGRAWALWLANWLFAGDQIHSEITNCLPAKAHLHGDLAAAWHSAGRQCEWKGSLVHGFDEAVPKSVVHVKERPDDLARQISEQQSVGRARSFQEFLPRESASFREDPRSSRRTWHRSDAEWRTVSPVSSRQPAR